MNILILVVIILFISTEGMSWSNSNANLIKQLKDNGVIQSQLVERAMLSVDRANFIYNNPYVDTPQLIGHGQTISGIYRTSSLV